MSHLRFHPQRGNTIQSMCNTVTVCNRFSRRIMMIITVYRCQKLLSLAILGMLNRNLWVLQRSTLLRKLVKHVGYIQS